MDWPARSPDLNPPERLWDRQKRQIRRHQPAPESLSDMEEASLAEWDSITDNFIRHLIESILRSLEAVIKARGGPTKY